MKTLTYYIVDVFAETKYQGNQLAVFLEAEGLTTEQMQTIAKEINFAESTFILKNEMQEGGFDVRIFTPAFEMPFAGHPTLGTSFVIQQHILRENVSNIQLNLKIGKIPVELSYSEGELDELWMTQVNPSFGRTYTREEVAPILGLEGQDLLADFPIQEVSTGMPFCIVPIRDLTTMRKIEVQLSEYNKFIHHHNPTLGKTGSHDAWLTAFHCFTTETYHPQNQLNVRMFDSYYGVTEDAATGSANGCLLGYLLKHQVLLNDTQLTLRVEQGYEMKRPSLLLLQGKVINSQEILVRVGGKVFGIAEGKWYV